MQMKRKTDKTCMMHLKRRMEMSNVSNWKKFVIYFFKTNRHNISLKRNSIESVEFSEWTRVFQQASQGRRKSYFIHIEIESVSYNRWYRSHEFRPLEVDRRPCYTFIFLHLFLLQRILLYVHIYINI